MRYSNKYERNLYDENMGLVEVISMGLCEKVQYEKGKASHSSSIESGIYEKLSS